MNLRSCPFCGSDAYMTGVHVYWVMCHRCKASIGNYDNREDAAYYWNKRRPELVPMDPLDIEELFDQAAGADEETHVRFARLIEQHHGITEKTTAPERSGTCAPQTDGVNT